MPGRTPDNAARQAPGLRPDDIAFIRSLVIEDAGGLIVLDKPSGLAVQGGSGVSRDVDGLLAGLAARGKSKPRLVHRLDRETSGLLVAARTRTLAADLSAALPDVRWRKTYLAVLPGDGSHLPGCIDLPLKRISQAGLDLSVPACPGEAGAQEAQTQVAVIARSPRACLVEARPLTGRMHQIRAHLAAVGRRSLAIANMAGCSLCRACRCRA